MPHDTEAPDLVDQMGWQLAALRERMARADATIAIVRNAVRDYDAVRGDQRADELDALRESVRVTIAAIESRALFDWYQRDAIVRRLRAHVERETR
jgi:hypothetical protein